MKFNLNEDNPGQHMAILGVAGVFILLSLIQAITPDSTPAMQPKNVDQSYAATGKVRYGNPEMTWYERMFCRGFQRSSMCSYRLLHPLRAAAEREGAQIYEAPPKKRKAVDYYSTEHSRSLSSRIVLDDIE